MNVSQQKMLLQFSNNIVAIDSTHCLNAYDFELTTLVVVDEWGEGFPGACLLTNRKDTLIFELFFQTIKNKIGVLTPNVFMTDITHIFYNAWRSIMGEVNMQLYCAWHVDRAWQLNMSKISNLEKRKIVYQSLKILHTVTDKEEFQKLLSNFIEQTFEDGETINFGEYFLNTYARNFQLWAYSYRQNAGINTNMRLESMHKIIKYVYLDGKKVKRLDKGLDALNKFIRDKVVERILKKVKGKNSSHIQLINKRHRTAIKEINQIKIIENINSSNMWYVSELGSTTSSIKSYEVAKNGEPCCHLTCSECHVCIHSFSCNCIDFSIKHTICKHIHSVASTLRQKSLERNINLGIIDNDDSVEIVDHLKTLSQNNDNITDNIQQLRKHATIEVSKLQHNIELIENADNLKHVVKTLKNENTMVECNLNTIKKFSPTTINVEPHNKKIKKQLTFYSTKKKKQVMNSKHISKPTVKEIVNIKECILGQSQFISRSTENDHNYF
ncbi:uncharacterized protein [Diabrotica undecimpunctata]|uniref:uncharacterized protein n=1 Tax=Diabrotica undecimpunctata TaxID=50387 RepID=UPI003B634FDC